MGKILVSQIFNTDKGETFMSLNPSVPPKCAEIMN